MFRPVSSATRNWVTNLLRINVQSVATTLEIIGSQKSKDQYISIITRGSFSVQDVDSGGRYESRTILIPFKGNHRLSQRPDRLPPTR